MQSFQKLQKAELQSFAVTQRAAKSSFSSFSVGILLPDAMETPSDNQADAASQPSAASASSHNITVTSASVLYDYAMEHISKLDIDVTTAFFIFLGFLTVLWLLGFEFLLTRRMIIDALKDLKVGTNRIARTVKELRRKSFHLMGLVAPLIYYFGKRSGLITQASLHCNAIHMTRSRFTTPLSTPPLRCVLCASQRCLALLILPCSFSSPFSLLPSRSSHLLSVST